MPQNPQRFWLVAIIVAWAVDFLFWNKPIGVSLLIFVALVLIGGFGLAKIEMVRPARFSAALSGLVVVLAFITVLRSDPFTRVLTGLLSLAGLALLAATFRTGAWVRFRILDYVITSFELLAAGLSRAAGMRLATSGEGSARRAAFRQMLPVVRGVMLALPVVFVLSALLASADLVFADSFNSLLDSFDISRLPEYLGRLLYILILAYLIAGIYVFAIVPESVNTRVSPSAAKNEDLAAVPQPESDDISIPAKAQSGSEPRPAQQPREEPRTSVSRFLGATEAFIVLGSVDLLFAFFVAIQFRYFFGGTTNITSAGYTFSEYARRGFFELVMVAVISLLLYLSLNAVTQRTTRKQANIFTVLAVVLVAFVLIILASGFQRLLLYEAAYGYTNLRIQTHIFMIWLGVLLAATIVLQIIRREQFFGALLIFIVFGFAFTFGMVNVDGIIVKQNVARANQGASLDGQHLVSLSDDALPVLVSEYQQPARHSQEIYDTLGKVIACKVYTLNREEPQPWQSYHLGEAIARQQVRGLDLSEYQVRGGPARPYVDVGLDRLDCVSARYLD